jgi:hypothetical protein
MMMLWEVAIKWRCSLYLLTQERLTVAIPLLVTRVFPSRHLNMCINDDVVVVFFSFKQRFWEEVLRVRRRSGVRWALF